MERVRANRDFPQPFRTAIELLAPCPISERPRSSRQLPHGYKDVCYWQHPTNRTEIVCTFRPERTNAWYLATWQLAENDDYATQIAAFEDQFLRREFRPLISSLPSHSSSLIPHPSLERDLLRRDACRSVAAYEGWHATAAKEFVVLDNLPSRGFVTALTNDFPVMRARYAATLPTPLDGTNVLCVARIFSSRGEYLDALSADGITNMTWSAAYWSPTRRELVAYLPREGEAGLLKTIRHEAFHQYLSYATSMISASPWLNEGYAQYFEQGVDDPFVDPADMTAYADRIVPLLMMDYGEFYSGTDAERTAKYRLALAVVYFLEKGAPKVRFAPFKDLKRDYLATLIETQDMRKATAAAFKDKDRLRLFVSEWVKFWKEQ